MGVVLDSGQFRIESITSLSSPWVRSHNSIHKFHMKLRDRFIAAIVLIVLLGLALSKTFVHLLTEIWWFDAVNFSEIFWTRLTWQAIAWIGTFALYAIVLWINYTLAMRLTSDRVARVFQGSELQSYSRTIFNGLAIFVIFLISLSAATASTNSWETLLKFLNATEFGISDPIYQRDLSFYFFQLPIYEGLREWLLNLAIACLVITIPIYALKGSFNARRNWLTGIDGKAKTHLSLLGTAIAILVGFTFWLQRYDLLYSSEGAVFGAGYTDIYGLLPAYWIMSILALVVAGVFFISIAQNSIALPIGAVAIYCLVTIITTALYPSFLQTFIVEPNELAKEQPYIDNNIQSTRIAYRLDNVETEDYPANAPLNQEELQNNQATVRNIRLWDYRPLLSTYRQLQEIRPYYRFKDVDIDRYTLDGNYRQVMLSARELSSAQLPARAKTWVNQRLKYTHGYGLVMSPVNRVTTDGLPELFIKDIPPVSEVDLTVDEAAIYYGEETTNYIITGTTTKEFDYPIGGENALTLYEGKGGVPLSSPFHRLAYAYEKADLNLLISKYLTGDSRIHYYRPIKERVQKVAPFLRFDNDPYLIAVDGRLKWIVDAYTTGDRYPYSEPVSRSENAARVLRGENIGDILRTDVNYIRNSVKVVVDAYDGTMQFMVVDEDDPLLATYRKIFPNLFAEPETITPEIRSHFRYPLDLFSIQAQMYRSYHMSDPAVFYNQEDLWQFPIEEYEGNERMMEPYYAIMSLPHQNQEEFLLILPFTPVNKDNTIAWMSALSDGDKYGELRLYEFPKQELVYGPRQIEARIDQTPEISQQLTLWSQEGSKVIRGNLLVIPIAGSLLYVEPVYLRAEQGELPELKRVIVAHNKEIVMTNSLDTSLAAIFGEGQPQQPTEQPAPTDETAVDAQQVQSALETYRKARDAARQGNWAEYGRQMEQLETKLEQLQQPD